MRHHPTGWARRWTTAVCGLALAGGTATVVAAAPAAAQNIPAATLAADSSGGSSGGSALYDAAATFEGPVTVGHIIEPESALPTGLAAHDYVEQEYFASGTAHAFTATSAPSNGNWSIAPTTSAAYKTRIIVRRPANPAHFNGTVVVEWMNESEGESAPDWMYLNPELMDEGDAWVGVSAQALGVDGGTPILGSIAGTSAGQGLVQQEPARYGTLHHPGDQYALDIFDQVGLGLRSTSSHVLGSLHPRHIVATGESQSAFYLTTFADALEPHGHPFAGIFIHSRGGTAAPLSGTSITSNSGPSNVRIRTDLGVPVFMFETQTDLIQLGYAPAQQPNAKDIRTWEVAGTSHADSYLLGPASSVLHCSSAINSGPQHVVAQSAFANFERWVVRRDPTAVSRTLPPLEPEPGSPGARPERQRDRRSPDAGRRRPRLHVERRGPGRHSTICSLFGSTTPFSSQMLVSLYGTKAKYISKYTADLNHAIEAGYLLPAERSSLLALAEQVQFPPS